MANRKLIPTTIIPPELYVHREADRQLRNAIRDMGRPAYVLVARQMGKTNLLLNAKRELENQANAFIYVDLSIPLHSDRECFRHIIDTAIGTKIEAFGKLEEAIQKTRANTNIAPFKEHESELKRLLDTIPGKLVIILDEIDSLTKGDFSDKVFAQIRSVYFSRINYPHLSRLTYILSGVVEPNDIIKDKRISPFNIGEKIYLDDFNASEFRDFLSRAELSLNPDVIERIYFWASGNPRITWDICADLEEKIHNGYFATTDEVDNSVKKLYLDGFNKAPVDHIREMVADDDALRSAITVIKYGKGETISDAVKNKLYLAGIIRSGTNYREIGIKNKVIEASLSDQWLMDISIQRKGLLKLAEEKFDEQKYSEALALFEEYLAKNPEPEEDKDFTFYHAGMSAYYVADYAKALGFIEKSHFEKDVAAGLYYKRYRILGLCLSQLGKYAESRRAFEEELKSPKKDSLHVAALLNIGATYYRSGDFKNALDTYLKALSEQEALATEESKKAGLSATLFHNLATTYHKINSAENAINYFEKAIAAALPEQKPSIMLGLIEALNSAVKKKEILSLCISNIIDLKLRPKSPDAERTLHFTKNHLLILLAESYQLDRHSFERLFGYASDNGELTSTRAQLLLQFALGYVGQRKIQTALAFAEGSISHQDALIEKVDQDTKFESFRLLTLLTKGNKKKKYARDTFALLKAGYRPKTLGHLDIDIFATILDTANASGDYKSMLADITFIKTLQSLFQPSEIGGFAFIYFTELSIYKRQGDFARLSICAKETLHFLDHLQEPNGSELVFGKNGLSEIRDFAISNIFSAQQGFTLQDSTKQLAFKKRPPNERVTVRYTDGTVKMDVKYKKIQEDLKAGRCELIDS